MREFDFNVKLPSYYTPDSVLVDTLKVCVQERQKNPKGLQSISSQLRGGMNRNQFETNYSQAPKDNLYQSYAEEVYSTFKQQKKEEDSDSGEDFDYGDEYDDEQPVEQLKGENIDLMAFISNMEMPTAQTTQINTTQKSQQNSAFDDLFFGEAPQQSQSMTN